jgi:hypothetical protein
MDERQVLELMRDVFMCEASWNVGLIAEINRRLAALTEAAQEKPDPTRCVVCGWPLAESRKQGCVAGDCSYRPTPGTPEHDRIKDRLRAQMSAPAAAQADGEEPTLEECVLRYSRHPGDCREAIADLRAFILASRARPAPSHALVEAGDAMRHAAHLLRTSCYQVQVTAEARVFDDAASLYDLARATLAAAKQEGGA